MLAPVAAQLAASRTHKCLPSKLGTLFNPANRRQRYGRSPPLLIDAAPSLDQLEQFADHCREVIETAHAMLVQNHLVMGQGRKGSNGQLGTSPDRDQQSVIKLACS